MKAPEALTLILAGGAGTRLHPLTVKRCKPAVPFAASLRIIDLTLMNCAAAGLSEVNILAQHGVAALYRHCWGRWRLPPAPQRRPMNLRLLPPQEQSRYAGTADAVRQNLSLLTVRQPDVVLVLSADHVCRVDYQELMRRHLENGADVTVLTGEVPAVEARAFGVLTVGERGRISRFIEKPANPGTYSRRGMCLINLGVYCFRPAFLREQLLADACHASSAHDFGRNILPMALLHGSLAACYHRDVCPDLRAYWRDIGTLDNYFETHMDLFCSPPLFELRDNRLGSGLALNAWLPARVPVMARIDGRVVLGHNLVAKGVRLESRDVVNSVISESVQIEDGAEVEDCILLAGARIGAGSRLRRAIVEERAYVPEGAQIGFGGFPPGVVASERGVSVFTAVERAQEAAACQGESARSATSSTALSHPAPRASSRAG